MAWFEGRFEVRAAWVLGIALPVLEVARRRTHIHPIAFYADDFIAGGLLLWAAWAAGRKLSYANSLLAGAWGVLCGGLYYSFFGHIEHGGEIDVSGLRAIYVNVVKGALFAIAILALVLSVRSAARWEERGDSE